MLRLKSGSLKSNLTLLIDMYTWKAPSSVRQPDPNLSLSMAVLQLEADPGAIATTLAVTLLAGLAYYASILIYRLTLHPLAGLPGPKLAGATLWYEFWFDVVKEGKYQFEIQRLHMTYESPIIRIGPNGVHVNDAAFADVVLAGAGQKRLKDPVQANQFGTSMSAFGIADHDLH